MRELATIKNLKSYLPERIVTNHELATQVDTTDEWIQQRTGIKERRIAKKEEAASDLGIAAAKKIFESGEVSPDDIDLILVATMSPDFISPSTASLVQKGIQATKAAAFDVGAACSGFIYGLSVAKAYIESHQANRILFVATEKMSSLINFEDRSTCVLFGDGAAALLIERGGEGLAIDEIMLGSDGTQCDLIKVPAGGSREPVSLDSVHAKRHFLTLEGREVFKQAVRKMGGALEACLLKKGITMDGVSYLIPHQANSRILDALAKHFSIAEEKVWKTVDRHGNTSAASIGLALDDLLSSKQVEKGAHIALAGFGAGLSYGSILLKKI